MSSSKRPIEEEDKAIMVDEDEICNDNESYSHTLVGKIWTGSPTTLEILNKQ
jgi:hypothetical protein